MMLLWRIGLRIFLHDGRVSFRCGIFCALVRLLVLLRGGKVVEWQGKGWSRGRRKVGEGVMLVVVVLNRRERRGLLTMMLREDLLVEEEVERGLKRKEEVGVERRCLMVEEEVEDRKQKLTIGLV